MNKHRPRDIEAAGMTGRRRIAAGRAQAALPQSHAHRADLNRLCFIRKYRKNDMRSAR
jgi:hypothetical protein